MPHPASVEKIDPPIKGWGKQPWGISPWGGGTHAGYDVGGQIVIRHDGPNPATKRNKFMRQQRQRMN